MSRKAINYSLIVVIAVVVFISIVMSFLKQEPVLLINTPTNGLDEEGFVSSSTLSDEADNIESQIQTIYEGEHKLEQLNDQSLEIITAANERIQKKQYSYLKPETELDIASQQKLEDLELRLNRLTND